jgi:hypothetical protein
LVRPKPRVACVASCAAIAITVDMRSAAGTTSQMSPHSFALAAGSFSARKNMPVAR